MNSVGRDIMREIGVAVTSLLVLATTNAQAGAGTRNKPAVTDAEIPAECRTWADDLAKARTEQLTLGAKLSLASCLAVDRFQSLNLTGDDAAIKALSEAVKPSLAILDQIMQGSDPAYQIMAAQAKGDLYDSMIVRIRYTGRSDLEPQLLPWSQAADVAYSEAVRVSKAHPELLGSNVVVASAVRSSESHLQARTPPSRK
jgi:hypothetical protein